ncbi:MAG: RnfABCDGE type electron transport complex subunit G, partial [Bacteroidales bacterium]|nr:RnfABCDGE type electron transport complex subunit G [Bacteroidales bacterium]
SYGLGGSVMCIRDTYTLTKDKIDAAAQQKKEAALKEVLPAYETLQEGKVALSEDPARELEYYMAYTGNELVGVAVSTYTKKGFNGEFNLMAGILPDGTLNKVSVLKQGETPGLGAKMTEPAFYAQFEGKHPSSFRFIVKKDGGDVDAITAATISSRAYCAALDRAFRVFTQLTAPEQAAEETTDAQSGATQTQSTNL